MHPVLNPVAPYRYMFPSKYSSMADIANPDFVGCCWRTWIILDSTRFYEEQYQPSIGSAWPACQKNGKSGAEGVNTICIGFDRPL